MSDIIIAFPNPGDSKVLRSILIKNGYSIVGVVASGAKAINLCDDIDYGIVICAYQLGDMQYMELKENINESCELLLVCSPNKLSEGLSEDINFLPIQRAKELLIKHKNMTEPEAHKYLQSSSMKNGDTIISTAKKICLLYGGKE